MHLDFYDNGAALTYKTLLQRIKTSPRFPESWPSMYSSVSANYNGRRKCHAIVYQAKRCRK